MLRRLCLFGLLLVAGALSAAETPAIQAVAKLDVNSSEASAPDGGAAGVPAKAGAGGAKTLSGISILGNQEAPKALVIVPWKSSQLGDTLGIDRSLDDSRQPVDRDVFMRELSYYEIRAGGT